MNTGTSNTVTVTKHIPITPSSEIVLNVEDIPPLDVFYSPKYKAVVKRQRKKRKIESAIATEAEQVDVLWKDPATEPTHNLTKLSQITGAYASATIDKAVEIQILLNEKEEQVKALQQQLQQVQANKEAQLKLEELQQQLQEMQIGHQKSLADKDKKIQIIQDQHKDDPKLPEFISETISLNNQLLQQEEVFCQKNLAMELFVPRER